MNNRFFPATYTPQSYIPAQPEPSRPLIAGFGWVDGINAARAQNIPYGASWIFFDVKDPIFYIKTVSADGVPQPLFIASYKQIAESDLPNTNQQAAQPQLDMSNYLKKEDLDLSQYATKADIQQIIDKLGSMKYVTSEEVENKILDVLQLKFSPEKQSTSKVIV